MEEKYQSFRAEGDGIARHLTTDVTICYSGIHFQTRALWDTGATRSGISKYIVDDLNIRPMKDTTETTSAFSTMNRHLYTVDIFLPKGIIFNNIVVSDVDFSKNDIEVIIGMDIISQGDFAVTNYNGKTVFSFRTPSQGVIDFEKPVDK